MKHGESVFLFSALLGGKSPACDDAFEKVERMGEEGWKKVVTIANHNLLTPSLYGTLVKKGLLERIEDTMLGEFLSEVYKINTIRNEEILAQLEEIQEILRTEEIEPLILKGGASVCEGLYPMPGMRMMNDLDIMISPDRFEDAKRLLFQNGYVEFGRDLERWHHHTPRIRKEGRPAAVEPHFRVIYDRYTEYIPYSEETTRYSSHPRLDASRVLKPTWHLYHTFLHAAVIDKHHKRWILGLRYLYDFTVLARSYGDDIDWKRLYALAERHGHHLILEDYLYMANRLYGLQTPLAFNKLRGWLQLKKSLWAAALEPESTIYKFYEALVDFSEIYGYDKLKAYYGLSSRIEYPRALARYVLYHGRKHLLQ